MPSAQSVMVTAGGREPDDRPDQSGACPDCPLGIVLMRLRPAETGEHAVAHELGDMALEAQGLAPAPAF